MQESVTVQSTTQAFTKQPAKNTGKLRYIDALRGLAILGVVVVHTSQYGHDIPTFHPALLSLVSSGARGVQLFFVASAFTLWLSMSRRKVEQHPTRNFFIRRVFRIAPMYWLGILFYSWWYTRMGVPPTGWSVLSNFTFLHGISPYWINSLVPGGWSITVEMTFYCLAPWLFTKIRSADHALRFVLGTALLAQLSSAVLLRFPLIADATVWQDFIFLNFFSQLPVFGVGILLYYLLQAESPIRLTTPTLFLLALTLLGALGFDTLGQAQHLLFSAGFLVLAVALSRQAHWLAVNPLITYLGKISFSLYLVHFSVLNALQHWGYENFLAPTRMSAALADCAIRLLVVLASSTVLATVFYELVEVRFQDLGKKLIARLER